MVGRRASIHVEALVWSDAVIEKLLSKHGIDTTEAESILDGSPLYFENALSETRVATHAIIGRSASGHAVAIYVSETAEPGVWYVHTAHRSRTAGRILSQEEGT